MRVIVWRCDICLHEYEQDMCPTGWQYFLSMTISPDGDTRLETSRLMICEECQDGDNEILNHKRRIRRIKNGMSTLPQGSEGSGDLPEPEPDGEEGDPLFDE